MAYDDAQAAELAYSRGLSTPDPGPSPQLSVCECPSMKSSLLSAQKNRCATGAPGGPIRTQLPVPAVVSAPTGACDGFPWRCADTLSTQEQHCWALFQVPISTHTAPLSDSGCPCGGECLLVSSSACLLYVLSGEHCRTVTPCVPQMVCMCCVGPLTRQRACGAAANKQQRLRLDVMMFGYKGCG